MPLPTEAPELVAQLGEWLSGGATNQKVSGKNAYRIEPAGNGFWRLRATIDGKRVFGGHIGKWEDCEKQFPKLVAKYKPRKKKVDDGK